MTYKKIAGIYILTNKNNGKMYIGQSIDLSQRINHYKNNRIEGQTKIYNAIKKYGFDKFDVEYLFTTTKKYKHLNWLLGTLEVYYIKKYKSIRLGYNLKSGGVHEKVNEETKWKLSENHKGLFAREKHYLYGKPMPEKTKAKLRGRKRTSEQIERIANAQKGKKMSDEFKRKMSLIQTGRKRSIGTRTKISNALKGKSKSESHKRSLGLIRHIPVIQYDKKGNPIKEWSYIKEAGDSLGIAPESISKVCKNKMKSAGGFVWMYKKLA